MKKKSAAALTFFNSRVLTAHRKQSRTRPFRMPTSLGRLLCAAGLRAILRNAFSESQIINRGIGVLYSRPLLSRALSAIVAAILLYGSNHADAQSQPAPMIGLFYLENADALGQQPYRW